MTNIRATGAGGPAVRARAAVRPSRRMLHVLLSTQSGIVVLLSINRLSDITDGYVADNEFLRWVDLNNLILALATLITAHLLVHHLEYDSARRGGRAHRAVGIAFLIGVSLYAGSYGEHEVTNYLHERFCTGTSDVGGRLCEIVVYHDDSFSHYLFFAGFTIINVAIMLTQVVFPDDRLPRPGETALVTVNSLFIAAGIVANLGFEQIGLDLYVVAAVAVLAIVLLVRQPAQLILRYYMVAYVLGLIGAGVAQLRLS